MKRKFLFLFLLLFPMFLFGNMAKPWIDGSKHSVLFGTENASVKNETIHIRMVKDSIEGTYSANFSIKYHIFSNQKQKLPLLFIAINLNGSKEIKVNHHSTEIKHLNFEKNTYSFLKQNQFGYYVNYDKNNQVYVNPDDLIYFSADLEKGDNIVEVHYNASLQYNTYGFVTTYEVLYSLSPSKSWESFGDIEVNLMLDENLELQKSNLGVEKLENKSFKWKISPKNTENIEISIAEKTSFISKILFFFQPLGISFIALFGMIFLHYKWMKSNLKKYILVLGIIIFPILFYVVYFLSFNLINFSLGKDHTKHGYTFFIVITYPIILLIYGLLTRQIFKKLNLNKNNL